MLLSLVCEEIGRDDPHHCLSVVGSVLLHSNEMCTDIPCLEDRTVTGALLSVDVMLPFAPYKKMRPLHMDDMKLCCMLLLSSCKANDLTSDCPTNMKWLHCKLAFRWQTLAPM